ncbi:BatA domain-containing protein [Leptobacterium sp. I13]|uniref:BatA domain-containing protein n=1 Tax=Leptobacterium meishanense TaxID=3128904 RepID=UPI0030EF88D2
MQFKYPEILWLLLLLIIPILIHLFQLRKFKKTPFTNVKLLKEIVLQTRKSAQLKKWLVLVTRLLILTAIIFAFSQPFIANRSAFNTDEIVIYLDNSFSMQLKGSKGELYNRAVQELINNVPESEEISLFTNTDKYDKVTIKAIQNELLQPDYSSIQLDLNEIYLRAKGIFSGDPNSRKNLIIISDFQERDSTPTISDTLLNNIFIRLNPVSTQNSYIDSVYISKATSTTIDMTVRLKKTGKESAVTSVSLYNNQNLTAKTAVDFGESNENSVIFNIPSNQVFNGEVRIEDTGLQYDNSLFFVINAPEKINVLSINEVTDNFLKRIFTPDEFVYTSFSPNDVNYSLFQNQNLIVLNELNNIPNPLSIALNQFVNNDGGNIIVIPSSNIELNNYNQFFRSFALNGFDSLIMNERRISQIQFSHPVYEDVFDKEIQNFQYPKVNTYYSMLGTYAFLLGYENDMPFLLEKNGIYVFTASLSDENSNFKNAPLIVPTFYSIAKKSYNLPELYYEIGRQNRIDIKTVLLDDEIVTIENENGAFIPLQQTYPNKVEVIMDEYPSISGIYTAKNSTKVIQNLAFNYPRTESNLTYYTLFLNDKNNTDTIQDVFNAIKTKRDINALWKWFVIFALVFLIIEMLILKYFK